MLKTAFIACTLSTVGIASPSLGEVFSAQRALTICMTTPQSPGDVLTVLYANGWQDIAAIDTIEAQNTWILGSFPTFEKIFSSQEVRKEELAKLQERYVSLSGKFSELPISVLHHAESGAILFVSTKDAEIKSIYCTLSVPLAATKPQQYQPKLVKPPAGENFQVTLDGFQNDASRIVVAITMTSVDAASLEDQLGVKTDIAAVFSTSIIYPPWAVAP